MMTPPLMAALLALAKTLSHTNPVHDVPGLELGMCKAAASQVVVSAAAVPGAAPMENEVPGV